MKSVLPFVLAVSVCALVSCGGSKDISATLKVASMKTTGSRALQSGRSLSAVPSSTAYSYAVVDGIKVNMIKVRGEDAASDNPLVEVAMAKELTLTGDPNQQIALNEAVTWKPGNYRGIDVHFQNSWSVKAYCRTQSQAAGGGYLIYTRAGDLGVVTCSRGDCTTLPTDYDYHSYSFLSTYSGYVSSNDYNQDTHYKFTVAEGQTPTINMLYDGSYNVACWDGQGAWNSSTALGAFRGPSTDAERQGFWPDSTPAMASSYLPFFAYLTTDASEAVPTARTFVSSGTSTAAVDPSDPAFDFHTLQVSTFVYKADGSPLTASSRNLQGNGADNPIDMEFEGFTAAARGGYDFFASGWYWPGGSVAPSFIRNRKFQAFDPPSTPATFTTNVIDGPDCGQTLVDFQGNNPSKACSGTGVTTPWYWREMVR